MLRIAVLVSGRGSNLKAILDHIRAGRIGAKVAIALSNNPGAPALALAKEAGIPVWAASHKDYPSREAFDAAMLDAMKSAGVEAVVLAGYMRLLSPAFITAYSGKILNVHPSLLPAFPGATGAADALRHGVALAGCTVHFVEEAVDAGPIIIQAAVPVREDDSEASLTERIHALEHRVYPQALAWYAAGRVSVVNRTVRIAPQRDFRLAPPAEEALVWPPLEEGF